MAQDILSDGFIKLCISADANWFGEGCKILLEGQMLPAGGAKPDTVIEVTGAKMIDDLFGAGSTLAESLKIAFCACPTGQIFALPRLAPPSAKKAAFKLKISTDDTSGAKSAGRFMLYLGSRDYTADFPVSIGDKAADIAKMLLSELSPNFPYDVKIEAGQGDEAEKAAVLVFAAKCAGSDGNYLLPVYNWLNKPNIAPAGVAAAMTEESKISPADDVEAKADYAKELGECCYACHVLLTENRKAQQLLRAHLQQAWDCEREQCFGHGYTYNCGTLGQVTAAGDNAAELSRMAINADCNVVFPYLLAANYGALSCCLGCANPEISVQGRQNGLLSCIYEPQSCAACWTQDEQASLRGNGFVVCAPSAIGASGLTHPYVQNDVTNYLYDEQYRENATFRSVASRRLAAATAVSLSRTLQDMNGKALFTRNTSLKSGTMGMTVPMILGRLRSWFKDNEGALFSAAADLDRDLQVQTDFDRKPPCQGRPGKLYVTLNYRPPERIEIIDVQLNPQMISNCDR